MMHNKRGRQILFLPPSHVAIVDRFLSFLALNRIANAVHAVRYTFSNKTQKIGVQPASGETP